MKMKLIGTPYRSFYTGMPPILLGGAGPNTVCILASSLLTGSVDFPSKFLYHTPLGYCQEKNSRKQEKMQDKIPEISKEKQKLLFRIKRIRGQFAAVERALTAGDECADILMLLAAIRGGVNGLMAEILEDHIRLHMMNPDHEMESPEELGEDLIGLVRAYLK
jgi:FrmR/RcnR family transcriptional regulator, repressor of rcnA expression